MEKDTDKINQLIKRLDALANQHQQLAEEMKSLTEEIQQLKSASPHFQEPELPVSSQKQPPPIPKAAVISEDTEKGHNEKTKEKEAFAAPVAVPEKDKSSIQQNLEEFIGGNLISKLGVGAIVIGMGIGLKYAIDNELISPLMRVLMGYLVGAVLLLLSYRSRSKYQIFGAVLFSGATALLFFTTYAAHSFFNLLPLGVAFGLMVALTVYTVIEALRFDQPVVAHIGLVGAYAVPFLLGGDPEGIAFLFSYVAIVNLGILCIAFFRYWKSLYYVAFAITWLIYSSWYALDYRESSHYSLAMVFLVIFFCIFYLAFLAYKLARREKFDFSDIVMLLLNSFFFYGLGYLILEGHESGQHQLGVFSMINALVHLVVSAIVWTFRLADRNLFYLVSGVGLIFTMIAIPVQFEGNWVTLLWIAEAALLFWIGRTQAAPVYERLSYALFVLGFVSLWNDWTAYNISSSTQIQPVFNIYFLTSLWSAACFGFSTYINRRIEPQPPGQGKELLEYILPFSFLIILYLGIQYEITHYFDQLKLSSQRGSDIDYFKICWQINFSLFFLSVLSLINIYRLKNMVLGSVSLVLSLIFVLLFIGISLDQLYSLHEIYTSQALNDQVNLGYVLIRYISYILAGGLVWTTFQLIQQPFWNIKLQPLLELLLHLTLLSVASTELHCWMASFGILDAYQAGLSILWGIYALILIVSGIRRSKKHLRIAAIVLIGITLGKVAVVDLADLETINKTIVLVILGALLLVISFLYNKFRERIFDPDGN